MGDTEPKRLLAQVHHVESPGNILAIELEFPDQIMERQEVKIRQLLKSLN